jgi:O-antigen/teichoic acid export membrane protein
MSAVRAAFLKGISEIISRAGALVALPVLMRFEGPSGYGAYVQIFAIVGIVVPFASLGLSSAMIRYFSSPAWSINLRSALVSATLTVIAVSFIVSICMSIEASALNSLLLNWSRGEDLLIVASVLVSILCLEQMIGNFFRARQWFPQLFMIEVAQGLITLISTLVFIPLGFGLVKLFIVISLLRATIIFFCYFSLWLWNRPVAASSGSTPELRTMIFFGLPTIIASFGLSLMHLSGRLTIGHFMNIEFVGYFGAIYGLAVLLVVVNSAFLQTLYPRLVIAFEANDLDMVKRTILVQHRFASLALFPTAALLVLIALPLLTFLTKETFPIESLAIGLIVMAIGLNQYSPAPHYVLMCKNQTKFYQYCWIGGGLLNLLLNIILVPQFGFMGAAVASFASMLLLEIVILTRAIRYIPLNNLYNFEATLRAIGATAIASLFILFTFRNVQASLSSLCLILFCFSVAYIISLTALGGVKSDDFSILRAAFSHKNGRLK